MQKYHNMLVSSKKQTKYHYMSLHLPWIELWRYDQINQSLHMHFKYNPTP